MDPGEDELQTAKRETQEEAGLTPADYTILEHYDVTLNYTVNNRPKRVVYWLGELTDINKPITLSDEHQDYKWLALDEAKHYADYADLQKAFDGCDAHIRTLKHL